MEITCSVVDANHFNVWQPGPDSCVHDVCGSADSTKVKPTRRLRAAREASSRAAGVFGDRSNAVGALHQRPMGFLVPNAPAYSDWDALLQRSVVPHSHGEHVGLDAAVETPCKPPFVDVPSSDSPPLLGSPAASSAAAGQLSGGQPIHSIAKQLLQTPAEPGGCVSISTGGSAGQARSAGSRGTCSTGCSGRSRASSSAGRTPTDAASAKDLEALSLALAWRLQQEEQQALARAIEANSPAPRTSQPSSRGVGAGSAPRAPEAGGCALAPQSAAGEGEMMEMDEEDASLRLALRLQEEELHWHEIASRRTVAEAMHIEPVQVGAFGSGDATQMHSDDDEP